MNDDELVGRPVPYFELPDLLGEPWTPRDLLGRPVVLFCFATW
jgi:peroxiredoxin